jgi:deoxycytidylate deaminase
LILGHVRGLRANRANIMTHRVGMGRGIAEEARRQAARSTERHAEERTRKSRGCAVRTLSLRSANQDKGVSRGERMSQEGQVQVLTTSDDLLLTANPLPLISGEFSDRAEIVIGLVGALGTDVKKVQSGLVHALAAVGYSTTPIRVSELIDEMAGSRIPQSETALDRLMDVGDALREAVDNGAAAAVLAIAAIRKARAEAGNETVAERQSHATIIRQLKHPDEVELLRSIYGPRFVLVGAWSPQSERENEVRSRLEGDHPGRGSGWYAEHQHRLLDRDEKDAVNPLGQQVRKTFELADAYVSLLPGADVGPSCTRLVRLLFGAPFETPTRAEQAMYIAAGARLRSAASGRQVGAVVVDKSGEILVTGTNDVPRAGGGQYWPDDAEDHRDFRYGFDVNDRHKLQLLTEIFQLLTSEGGWLSPEGANREPQELARQALRGPLAGSRLTDLLEFGRIAHAEMAAICTAARRGTPLGGQTMYTTTYPCHECARLIIAAGITRVVYVDPYPKSQVRELFRHEIVDGPYSGDDRVIFEPFTGVAPRMFASVFSITGRARDQVTGEYVDWEPTLAPPRLVADARATTSYTSMELGVLKQQRDRLAAAGWLVDPQSDAAAASQV